MKISGSAHVTHLSIATWNIIIIVNFAEAVREQSRVSDIVYLGVILTMTVLLHVFVSKTTGKYIFNFIPL